MDDARSSKLLADKLTASFDQRVIKAKEYNDRLADPNTPLPRVQKWLYPILPHREKREKDFRTNFGKKKASLAWALSDTFGNFFWMGAIFKIGADLCTSFSPLLIKALIKFSTEWQVAQATGQPAPNVGRGVGMAIGLFCLLACSSIGIHHFFVRECFPDYRLALAEPVKGGMATGVMSRAAIISAVYNRSLRLTQKSRGELPNGKIVNHISTDTSRIDFCAGFYLVMWTAPSGSSYRAGKIMPLTSDFPAVQFIVIMIILLVEIGYSALPGIGFLIIAMPLQMVVMKNLFKMRKKSMIWTDKRAKLLQELLGGMRIVKFMAWENPFLDRLSGIRGLELKYVRKLLTARSGMMAFAMSLPVLAAILSFITYKSTSHGLQAATIFTVITLFQLMRMPLMIWPMTLSATADAQNAISRLEVVFEAEVLTEGRVINPDMEDGVRIEKASFTWDAAPIVDDKEMNKLKGKHLKAITGYSSAPDARKKKNRRMVWSRKQKKVTLADEAHLDISGGGPNDAEAGLSGPTGGGVTQTVPGIENGTTTVEEQIFQIHDIDLAIPRGSLTAIVGAIGSGKTSLLQGLMGGE